MRVVQFSARVPDKEYRAFKAAFPQYGAVDWFINTALRRFNEEVRKNPTSVESINKLVDDIIQQQKTQEAQQSA